MIIDSTPLYGFISTGDKTAMYTLRVMCRDRVSVGREVYVIAQDHFIKILSNDKAKAENSAQELCDDMCVPLKSDASFDLNEIKRRKSEEVQAEREARERSIREYQERIENEFQEGIRGDVFLIGKHIGKNPSEVDVGYLFWLADQEISSNKSRYDINIQIASNYIKENNIQRPGYVGFLHEPIELELKLISCFATQGVYPSYIFKTVTPAQEQVVFFSTSKKFLALNKGDTFKITGSVRSHDEYNGQFSTCIAKPKMVK